MIAFKTYDLQKINRQLEEQKKGYIEKIEEENQEHAKLLSKRNIANQICILKR